MKEELLKIVQESLSSEEVEKIPMAAVKMNRRGYGCELNPDYFRDGVGYLQAAEDEVDEPTLFDFMEV